MRGIYKACLAVTLVGACSGAEDTNVFVQSKSPDRAVIGIHISLLNHPPETHVLGYDKMQRLAEVTCREQGKSSARFTGKHERKTAGTAYDTWIERTYDCL